jgi:hypothetical protein
VDNHNRYFGFAEHLLRDASDEDAAQSALTVRSHDNKVAFLLRRDLEDFVLGVVARRLER